MKTKFLSLLVSAVGIVALSACAKNGGTVTDDSFIPANGKYEEFDFRSPGYLDNDYFALKHLIYDLFVGESKQIVIDTLPTGYATSSLVFSSKDESVVTVDQTGKLTAVSKGIADVEVKSQDEAVSSFVRVVVSSPTTQEDSEDVITAFNNAHDELGYANKVLRYEYSEELYSCEGVLDHGTKSFELMGYDAAQGYFFVEGPSLYFKTPGGTPELANGKWIFYPINQGVMTRLIHITPTAKNYFDINTANYESYDRIIRDIMNFFFVSGEQIMDNLLDAYDGAEDFNDFLGYSTTQLFGVNDNSLFYKYTEARNNRVVSADDEINYYDIPADTVYNYEYQQNTIYSAGRALGLDVTLTFFYERDGKNWTREFNRSQLFESDFDTTKIQNPKDNGFQEVDSIYDL